MFLVCGCNLAVSVYDAAPPTILRNGGGRGAHQIVAESNRHDSTWPPRERLVFSEGEFMGLSERKEAIAAAQPSAANTGAGRRTPQAAPAADHDEHGDVGHQPGSGPTVEEAAELAANAKRAALAMFPDKEFAYDILYRPRLQRLIAERFRVQ